MLDCPVTQHDIKVAEDMFGPNLGSIKGKDHDMGIDQELYRFRANIGH